MNQEPLQLVPLEKWSELQDVFLLDWPRSLPGYNVLETQCRLQKEGLDYGFKVYSLFGDLRNGFIAINDKNNFYELIIQYPKDDTGILAQALEATEVINWETRIILAFSAYHVISAIEPVIQDKGLQLDLLPSYTFIIKKGSPLFEDIGLPPGFTFELLSAEHIDLIDSKWPHRYPTSPWFFELLINSNSGYGLFKNGILTCWIFVSECGQLTHLFTMEEYRKQGLAELALKLICNELLRTNRQVFAFCVKGNDKACRLYRKLGFQYSTEVTWGYVYRKNNLKNIQG